MIRVHVNGAKGRMGREVVKAVSGASDLELVGQTDVEDNLRESLLSVKPDVVVDFTVPQSVFECTKTIIECGFRPVVGTTGLRPEEIEFLKKLARERSVGGIIAPNFALGAVLLMHFAEHAARWFPCVEIIELHHEKKIDAPSGTARLTAEKIAKARGQAPAIDQASAFRGGNVEGIPVHSIRLPGLVAHQEVIFGGQGQCLTLRHDSLSRESFMPGVLLAIRKAPQLKELVVGLEKILGLEE